MLFSLRLDSLKKCGENAVKIMMHGDLSPPKHEKTLRMVRRQPAYSSRTPRFWVTLGWLVLLTGCTTLSGAARQDFQLLPPDTIKQSVTVLLKLDSSQGEVSYHREAVLNVDAERIYLVILGPLGQRLATLDFDGQRLTVDRSSPIPFDASLEKLLGELQMIFWPLTALNAGEWNQDWFFDEKKNIRLVYHKQKLVAEIHRHSPSPWNGSFHYNSKISDYHLSIHSSQLNQ
ncbi:MAG: DUF3261 domain-containing protein [Gammaproteobacteria bacterium]|nr:DUF3261 domain-containing protein [Gammaproteobacteria bacterium]